MIIPVERVDEAKGLRELSARRARPGPRAAIGPGRRPRRRDRRHGGTGGAGAMDVADVLRHRAKPRRRRLARAPALVFGIPRAPETLDVVGELLARVGAVETAVHRIRFLLVEITHWNK